MRTEDTKVDLSRVKGFFSTHTPHAGVDKPFISWLGEHWPIPMAKDCLTRWTALPSLEFFKTPTGQELLELWDIRGETRKR